MPCTPVITLNNGKLAVCHASKLQVEYSNKADAKQSLKEAELKNKMSNKIACAKRYNKKHDIW